jgi:hypothetical protein
LLSGVGNIPLKLYFYLLEPVIMNIFYPLKKALILRNLNKRRSAHPFIPEDAERYTIPADADKYQNNSYYFSCHDTLGNSLLVRHAQRGPEFVEVWFAYRDAAGRALINGRQLCPAREASSAVRCIEPEKKWAFLFDGDAQDVRTGQHVSVKLDAVFDTAGGIFEFGHDVDARVMAQAIAKEKWSRAYFEELKGNDQVHYEQPGRVKGTLELAGETIEIDLPAMRDHSFGKRDWGYMNKHFWLMALLPDGRQLNANMVSYPVLKLMTGYYVGDGKTVCVQSARIVEDVVKPHEVPEAFTFEARLTDGKTLEVKCRCEEVFPFPFDGGVYTIYEGVGSFELDGTKGRGILEFGWNGDAARCV